MSRIENRSIAVPLEFKVACTVSKLKIAQVLQIFVDHVSLYDSLSRDYSKGFTEATRAILDYALSKNKKGEANKAFQNCKDDAVNCIHHIHKLIAEPKGSFQQKRKKAVPHIAKLFNAIEWVFAPADKVYIEEDTLHLSKDFRVICELHNCQPIEYLQYFMGKISLADFHARTGLKLENQNPSLAFYLLIIRGLGRDILEIQHYSETEADFFDKKQEVLLEIYNIRDLEERTEILRKFFLSHYQNMNQFNA